MADLRTPLKIGGLTLKNRLVMAPMQQRHGTKEGFATDYHAEHYSRRAQGGVGLVIVESTAVSEYGRLFPDDIGIFSDAHVVGLHQLTEAVHRFETPVFIQLCHGGRKASGELYDRLLAPSAIAFDESYQVPVEMTPNDIQRVVRDFAAAAKRAVQAGFDGIELHAAHGYLMHQFLSPLSNRRTDEYGGSLDHRMRFAREVLEAVRREVGQEYPVMIRVSASDYAEGGLTPNEVGEIMKVLSPLGLDAVHVSSGGALPVPPTKIGAGYQVPFAETIKKYVSVPVIAVGIIHTAELANQILQEGLADAIAVGRPLLEDADYGLKMLNGEV